MNRHLDGFEKNLRVLAGLKSSSIAAYVKKVEEFFFWYRENPAETGDIDVSDLDPAQVVSRKDVERFLHSCFYRGNSNATRLMKLTAIRKFSRYLKYEGIIGADFTEDIPKPRTSITRVQKFTQGEILDMFRAIDVTKEKGLRDRVIFILAAFGGLRVGEISHLRITDVVDNGKYIDIGIESSMAKLGHGRTVWLWKAPSDHVREYLITRLGHSPKLTAPFIVSYKHRRPSPRPMSGSDLDGLVKRYAKTAGIRRSRVNFHMFRATHANDLRSVEGFDAPAIAARLGHANISTTDRYLPDRGRIHRTFKSLSAYWADYTNIWRLENADTGSAGAHDHGGAENDEKG